MEALYENTNRGRLDQLILGNTRYENGFERETELPDFELRERRLLLDGRVSFYRLQQHANHRYPYDIDLASYTWRTLLSDSTFYELMYPGTSFRGREYELEVVHIKTGLSREKWLIDGGDANELLNSQAWAIGIMSLKNQYHKLYVHDDKLDGYNLCRDGFNHHNRGLERVHVDRLLSRIEASIGLDEWHRQAKIQGVNPCIYTFVQRWVITSLPSL
jgi:hypothetical protein